MSLAPVHADTRPSARVWDDALAGLDLSTQPRLVAQPIVDLAGLRVAGYELLSRFDAAPQAGPDRWFAEAARRDVAVGLTVAVVERALRMRGELPDDRFVTVNVEPAVLVEPRVRAALAGAGSLHRVVVELTEHSDVADCPAVHAALGEIRTAGGLIAVDDAGTGYAGLSALAAIRPDIVKVARELVAGLHADPVRRGMVALLGSVAGRMDAWLLAEGVETADELAVLYELGVPLAQGFLFARPEHGFRDVSGQVLEVLRTHQHRSLLTEHVAPLVRAVEAVDANGWAGEPAATAGVVLVDASGFAVAVSVSDLTGSVGLAPALTVAPSTSLADALQRAMARLPQHRHVPLVCTDRRGTVIGLVEVADLVETVVTQRRREEQA